MSDKGNLNNSINKDAHIISSIYDHFVERVIFRGLRLRVRSGIGDCCDLVHEVCNIFALLHCIFQGQLRLLGSVREYDANLI